MNNEELPYEKRYPRIAREKLVIPRTMEGTLNLDFYDVAKELNDILSDTPGYVGLAPVGSRTRGYARQGSEQESDVDVLFFYDSSKTPRHEFEFARHSAISAVQNSQGKTIDSGFPINVTHMGIVYSLLPLSRGQTQETQLGFLFAQTAIGPHIDESRKQVAEYLKTFPSPSRAKAIRGLADATVALEMKFEDRIYRMNIPKDELDKMWSGRQQQWEKQIVESIKLYSS